MRISLFLAVCLFAALPAMAHEENAEAKAAVDPNKVICKTEDVIGSHLQSQKRCMTEAQWVQARRNDRDNIDSMQHSSSGSGH